MKINKEKEVNTELHQKRPGKSHTKMKQRLTISQ